MASTLITTTSLAKPWDTHNTALVRAGTRLWMCANTGTVVPTGGSSGFSLWYSDDDGATWTYHSQSVNSTVYGGTLLAYELAGAWHLEIIIYTLTGSNTNGIFHQAIRTNVASGVPGARIAQVALSATASGLGVSGGYVFITNTATNPRLWVVGRKAATTTSYDVQAWYCAAGSAADTATNWVSTNFTALASAVANTNYPAVGASWTIGGQPRATIINASGSSDAAVARTFDPTAATPTPGTATSFAASGTHDNYTEGPNYLIAAKADYMIFGRRVSASSTTWEFYKSVNGTTWTQPTGWSALSMIRGSLRCDGTDFYLLYTTADLLGSTAAQLQYRKITAATDTMGAAVNFSDTAGQAPVLQLGDSELLAIYRDGTAANYGLRSDTLTLTAPSAPAQNENITVTVGNRFRLRIEVQETGAVAVATAYKLRSAKNAGAYADVATASGDVRVVDSPHFAHGDATTNLLTGGTGTFVAGQGLDTSGTSSSISLGASGHTELEWSLILFSGTAGDTHDFRVTRSDGTVLNTYTVTPRITAA